MIRVKTHYVHKSLLTTLLIVHCSPMLVGHRCSRIVQQVKCIILILVLYLYYTLYYTCVILRMIVGCNAKPKRRVARLKIKGESRVVHVWCASQFNPNRGKHSKWYASAKVWIVRQVQACQVGQETKLGRDRPRQVCALEAQSFQL